MPVTVTPLLKSVLLLFALLAFGALAAADPAAAVKVDARSFIELDHAGWLRETDARIAPEDVMGRAGGDSLFRPLPDAVAAFGFSERTHWLHVRLHNPDGEARDRVVAIDNPLLDDVRYYLRKADGRSTRLDNSSDPSRALLRLEPRQDADLFVRIAGNESMRVPLALYQPVAYASQLQSQRLWLGLLIGALVALAAYNLLLAITLRKRSCLWFVGHLLSFGVLVALLGGLGLAGARSQLGAHGNPATAAWSLVMLCLLASAACRLDLQRERPWAFRLVIAMVALRGVLALLALFVSVPWLARFGMAWVVVEVVVIVVTCLAMLGRRRADASLLLGAWSLLLAALLSHALVALGWLPANTLADGGLSLGLLVGATVISFASALRYESLGKQVEKATLNASTGLEKGVAERTRTLAQTMAALNEANQRLRDANDRDGLTGVFNRRYFDHNIEAMLSRSRIAHQPFSALVADIDHFKSVNDSAGHLAGDDCIRLVARVLQEVVGNGNPVIRYGGEEFVVLLPGVTAAAAIGIAEKIRSAVSAETVTTRSQVIRLTISIGVETAAANQRISAASLIRNADQALYAAKGDGRNRVVHAHALARPAATH